MNSRKIIVEILDKVFFEKTYSNLELGKRLNESSLNDKDKALVTEIVYGTIKYKLYIDSIIKNFVNSIDDIDPKVINILRSAIYQIKFLDRVPDYAVVNEAVNLTKEIDSSLTSFINGVLRNYLRNKDNITIKTLGTKEKLSIEYSFPKWIIQKFLKQYGLEETERILRGLNSIPDVTIRVNSLKGDYDDVFSELEEAGYEVEEGVVCPEAIKISRGKNIEKNPLFNEGKITVQDESAMLVAPLMDLEEDMKVLDICSAPGGKTTHISELMNNKGEVYAFDIYDHKLDLIKENAGRLGLSNIKTEIMDGTKINSDFINFADRVLIDVPCSGLGIIRKKPEIKWNKTNKDVEELIVIQKQIMENAWNYLKKGGVMLYSTCTLNKEENEDNIEWFLKKNKDAVIEDIYVGKLDNIIYNNDKTITVLPNKNMDGFFIAKLKKI
ncbi:16S rRNA (cytosine(967)-C(5))-methyltransferase RsmB [Clostridium fallax]|uniref:16S rRNA (cytosine(967)-C(5))-methyltransferase n=1 Tax=Clostridium fallax TaxID=1533 RepID=A0A1M4UU48_9CLOT|nr:16S rRNA (cytosine(967)-C(5))-methyltransferase RsmB [Clostridium fallax]SHE60198.1 16S rRNA (cytosine967-C5)-methyltransferase [Clostridium fallax]SQB07302.1 RNA-binding Sun protein [Clostridium fallax]